MAKVILKNVRGSYVYLATTRKNKKKPDDPGTYQMQVLLDKDDDAEQIENFKKVSIATLRDRFGPKAKGGMYKMPLRDGDEERDTDEAPEYKNKMFFNCTAGKTAEGTPRKPGIVNRAGKPATDDDMEAMGWSGSYFHVSVNLYAFDGDESKGVGAGLSNVMLRKEGERLDGSVSAESEFSEFADDDDDDDDWDDDTF